MSDKDVPEDIPTDETTATSDAAEAEIAATVEAILFATDKPLPAAKVGEVGQLGGVRAVRKAVDALNARYERIGATFRILEIAGGYQMQSLPEYADVLARLSGSRADSRLTQAAMETLTIVAYRQPILRADIEAIRGVACGEVLRGLMEKNLVRIAGRAEEIGRPLLYGTTRHFLEVFGLAGLEELPNAEQLRMPAEQAKAAMKAAAAAATEPHATGAEPAPPDEATPEGAAAAAEMRPAEIDQMPTDETKDEDELRPAPVEGDEEPTDEDLDEDELDDEDDDEFEDDDDEEDEEDGDEEDDEDEDL